MCGVRVLTDNRAQVLARLFRDGNFLAKSGAQKPPLIPFTTLGRAWVRLCSNRLANYIPSFDAEILRCSQQMCVIRIYDTERKFGRRRQVNGIGCPQKHNRWQLLIDVPDSQENLAILRKPPESSRIYMCPYLAH